MSAKRIIRAARYLLAMVTAFLTRSGCSSLTETWAASQTTAVAAHVAPCNSVFHAIRRIPSNRHTLLLQEVTKRLDLITGFGRL